MAAPVKFSFGSKAETLAALAPCLTTCIVPPLLVFSARDWRERRDVQLETIKTTFGQGAIAVRSSSRHEDSAVQSFAGTYHSELNVDCGNTDAVTAAVNRVLNSYLEKHGWDDDDQVLCQAMVAAPVMSGVVFTRDPNSGAPYFVINYDDRSGRTDSVTSGARAQGSRTLIVYRVSSVPPRSARFRSLLRAIREIECATGCDALDIEFALSSATDVHLLQVRRITTLSPSSDSLLDRFQAALTSARSFITERLHPRPFVLGERGALGIMPDWNPAEIIGATPRPLALSLYRYLITDGAWRIARREMGYRDPHGCELMVSVCGRPYIDVRLSFNSFLPASLPDGIAVKLVNAWLERLSAHTDLHDKVEFLVAITTFSFDYDQLMKAFYPGLLSPADNDIFRQALIDLTRPLLSTAALEAEMGLLNRLEAHRQAFHEQGGGVESLRGLLEHCIRFGTTPFSKLARHAFMATSLLSSMVREKLITEAERDLFWASMQTVTHSFSEALVMARDNPAGQTAFMVEYGHLRPGTYDILSPRYDQRPELFIDGQCGLPHSRVPKVFALSSKSEDRVYRRLQAEGLTLSVEELFAYLRLAISSREHAKLLFTRTMSDAIEVIADWGLALELTREQLSFLTIDDVFDAIVGCGETTRQETLASAAALRVKQHHLTHALRLPYLITSGDDIEIFPLLVNSPNFVTRKRVSGQFVVLDGRQQWESGSLDGKLILIESADPGFDWIFSQEPLGLLTQYGGANSHMAIRCAEFALPAAIGCGEQLFDELLRAHFIDLDCGAGKVRGYD